MADRGPERNDIHQSDGHQPAPAVARGRQERRSARVRSTGVYREKIQARLTDGVLELTLPRRVMAAAVKLREVAYPGFYAAAA